VGKYKPGPDDGPMKDRNMSLS